MVLKFEIRQKFKPVFFEKLLYLQTARLLFHKICLVAQYTEYIHAYIFAKKGLLNLIVGICHLELFGYSTVEL